MASCDCLSLSDAQPVPSSLKKNEEALSLGNTDGVQEWRLAGDDQALLSNVVVARLTLAQSQLEEEHFEQAVEVFNSAPSSVTKAIGDGSEGRPTVGIRSVAFARLAYTTLTKAHLGAKQPDQARSAMTTLSKIAGADDPAALAQLHLELSSEMAVSYTKLATEGQENIELLTTTAASLK